MVGKAVVEICQGLLKRILCEMNWHLLMLRLGLMRNTTKMKPTLLEPLPFTGLENLPIKKSILGWWSSSRLCSVEYDGSNSVK